MIEKAIFMRIVRAGLGVYQDATEAATASKKAEELVTAAQQTEGAEA